MRPTNRDLSPLPTQPLGPQVKPLEDGYLTWESLRITPGPTQPLTTISPHSLFPFLQLLAEVVAPVSPSQDAERESRRYPSVSGASPSPGHPPEALSQRTNGDVVHDHGQTKGCLHHPLGYPSAKQPQLCSHASNFSQRLRK